MCETMFAIVFIHMKYWILLDIVSKTNSYRWPFWLSDSWINSPRPLWTSKGLGSILNSCSLLFHRSFQANINLHKDYPQFCVPRQRIGLHQTTKEPLNQPVAVRHISIPSLQKRSWQPKLKAELKEMLLFHASRGSSTYVTGDLHSRWRQVQPIGAIYHLSPPCEFNTAASTEGNKRAV